MPNRLPRRGQAAVTDLFIAVAIFIVLVTITTLLWNLYNARLESRLDYDIMVLKAYTISDTLAKSPGFPANWENNTVPELNTGMVGLAEYDRVISPRKLDTFVQISQPQANYTNVTHLLKIPAYDFYFVLRNENGTAVVQGGRVPQGKFTVNLARIVMYRGGPHLIEFAVWK